MEISRFFAGLICAIIAIIIYIIHKLKILRCTEKTTGKIVQTDTESVSYTDNDGIGTRSIEYYYIYCQYSIGEHNFEEKVKIGSSNDIINRKKYYNRTSVDVYYNPKNYKDCYIKGLDYSYKKSIRLSIIAGVLLTFVLHIDIIITFIANCFS